MTNPETLPHSCGRCRNRWAGSNTSHCGSCCQTFSSLTAFDAHRIRRGPAEGTCANPGDVSLELRDRAGYQVWGYPADDAALERLQAAKAATNAA